MKLKKRTRLVEGVCAANVRDVLLPSVARCCKAGAPIHCKGQQEKPFLWCGACRPLTEVSVRGVAVHVRQSVEERCIEV